MRPGCRGAAQLTHQKADEVDHGQQPDGADVQHNQRHRAVVRRLIAPTGHSDTPVDEPGQPVADLNHLRKTETTSQAGARANAAKRLRNANLADGLVLSP